MRRRIEGVGHGDRESAWEREKERVGEREGEGDGERERLGERKSE